MRRLDPRIQGGHSNDASWVLGSGADDIHTSILHSTYHPGQASVSEREPGSMGEPEPGRAMDRRVKPEGDSGVATAVRPPRGETTEPALLARAAFRLAP